MNFSKMRQLMVDRQIISRDIRDERVISVMREVPRHKFVPDKLLNDSYDDYPLPIGNNQTISQPYIVALMTENLNLKLTDKVLEIGTGSGYQAAILSKLCARVYTIERVGALLKKAEGVFKELNIANISTKLADGSLGWEEFAPFEAIIVTAAAAAIPPLLIEQLRVDGRLIIPLGSGFGQTLTLIIKKNDGLDEHHICGCSFVPLIEKGAIEENKT